jgi:CheY-like chemotaxis protein
MFYQVRDNFESSRAGLGIGLTLVRQLVEMHGGRVEARSAGVGSGSEFIIHLPDRDSAVNPEVRSTPAVRTDAVTNDFPRRILVVDDNQDSAESLAILLRIHGHDVRSAFDGFQALQDGGSFHPEVVILDLGMPTMNGFEVARAIRLENWGKQILLVALTGWGREEDRRRVREAGFDAHLTKPLSYNELKKLVIESPTSA